jgi:hypothetical protein
MEFSKPRAPAAIANLTEHKQQYVWSSVRYTWSSVREPLNKSELRSSILSGANAHVAFATFAARLKSCLVTK